MKKLLSLTTLLLAIGVTASATTLEIGGDLFPGFTPPELAAFHGTLNGSVPVTLFCVDFNNGFDADTPYTINVTNIPSSPDFAQDTRAGGYTGSWIYFNGTYTALQRYEMAGYLTTLYAANVGSHTAMDAIQQAIWTLVDMNNSLTFGCDTTGLCNTDILNAFTALPGFLANNTVNIYSDSRADCIAGSATNNGSAPALGQFCMQEFVSVDPVVPEPNSAALMGLGGALLGLGAWGKRKLARS